jgi:hypothetical protein
MRWRIPILLALVGFVAASCDQQPAEPQLDHVTEALTLNFMNGPENPGESDVYRWDGRFIFWTDHPDLNLATEYMYAEDQGWYGTWKQYHCGGTHDHPKWDMQESGNQENRVTMVAQRKNTPVYVYHSDELGAAYHTDEATFCEYIANEWLYKGEIDMIYTDNNSWWWLNPDAQGNPFGFRANGHVWDPDGNRYSYHEHVRMFCKADDCEYTHYKLVIK